MTVKSIDIEGVTDWMAARRYSYGTISKMTPVFRRLKAHGLSEMDINTMKLEDIYLKIYGRPMTTQGMRRHIRTVIRRYQEYQDWRDSTA